MFKRRTVRACEPEEDDLEETVLEYGSAYSDASTASLQLTTVSQINIRVEDLERFYCPNCSRHLLDADQTSVGLIVVTCRKCKRLFGIQLTGKSGRVGFL